MKFKGECAMLRLTLALIGLACLSACATVVSDTCPTLFDYSEAEQARAADELDALPEGSALERLVGDYGVVRNEIRACKGQ